MTSPQELTHEPSPYISSIIPAHEIGIDSPAKIQFERLEGVGATNVEQAAADFEKFGAVLLDPSLILEDGGGNTVESTVQPIREATIANLQKYADDVTVLRPKNYVAYNDTPRALTTVSFPNVITHFPEVISMQQQFLPTIRMIAHDPEVEISIDPDEGTVINTQIFMEGGDANERQQHGAHTDRVDITMVTGNDNIGPNGDLVVVSGYTVACKKLGLDPHRHFDDNLRTILDADPNSVIFRAHPVKAGTVLLLKSAADVHFITPKTGADVQAGIDAGQVPIRMGQEGKKLIGRSINNAAYESGPARALHLKAQTVASRLPKAANYDEIFINIDRELAVAIQNGEITAEEYDACRNAIVTSLSAADLYSEDTVVNQSN